MNLKIWNYYGTNESFSKYLNSYKGFLDYNDKKYVNQYHYYIFCKT